jgi:tetratricopeptide (TPR) repeat protein
VRARLALTRLRLGHYSEALEVLEAADLSGAGTRVLELDSIVRAEVERSTPLRPGAEEALAALVAEEARRGIFSRAASGEALAGEGVASARVLLSRLRDEVLGLDHRIGRAYTFQGRLHLSLGENLEALQCLNRALQLDPSEPRTLYARASTFFALRRYRECLEDLARAEGVLDRRGGDAPFRARISGLRRAVQGIQGR